MTLEKVYKMSYPCRSLADNPYPATIFVLKMLSAFYIQVQFRLDFFMEAIDMNPDQTAPKEQSDLGPYCLQAV